MSAYLGNLQIFDHKTSEWQIFKGKLVQFLKINKVEDDGNKIGVLLTHVTDETYRLVRNLAYPQELESLSYAGLVGLLDSHFKLKQCSFADKAKFYGASRSPGESLGDWAARLRGLATYCDFGTALETNLVDRFVLGLGSGPERDKLFEQKPSSLTLTRAIELAEQAECAKKAKALPAAGEIQVKEEPLFRAKFQGRGGRATQARRGRAGGNASASDGDSAKLHDASRCSVCGLKNHKSDQCFYKSYKCKKCFMKGHLKKTCPNVRSSVYHVDNEEVSDEGQEACEECQNFNISERSSNFSNSEVEKFKKLINKYSKIILNKKTNGLSIKQKDETWDIIAKEFNASSNAYRSVKQLKYKWEYMKKSARKEAGKVNRMRRQTGGGPPPPPLSTTSEWVSGILKESASGIDSQYDGDACNNIVVEPPPTSICATVNVKDSSTDVVEIKDMLIENVEQEQPSTPVSATVNKPAARKLINATPHHTRQSFLELAKLKKDLVQLKTKKAESKDQSTLVSLREERIRLEMDLLKKAFENDEKRKQELHELHVVKMKLEIAFSSKNTE